VITAGQTRRCAMSEKDIQKDDLVGKTKAIRDHDHDMTTT
jgi:hypothetical protein